MVRSSSATISRREKLCTARLIAVNFAETGEASYSTVGSVLDPVRIHCSLMSVGLYIFTTVGKQLISKF